MELFEINAILANEMLTVAPAFNSVTFNILGDTVKYFNDGFVLTSQQQINQLIGSSTQVFQTQDIFTTDGGTFKHEFGDNFRTDLEDFSGRGILLAAPQFYLSLVHRSRSVAVDLDQVVDVFVDIYYRFVQIPFSEYLGIIQSQAYAQKLL